MDNSPQSSIEVISSRNGRRNLLPLLLLVSVIIILGGVVLYIHNASRIVFAPIGFDKPYIKGYGMSYYLEGKIEEIKKDSQGMELITDIKDSQVPKFYVDSNTSIYAQSNEGFRSIRAEELKKDQKVLIYIYQPQMESWVTSRVTILP